MARGGKNQSKRKTPNEDHMVKRGAEESDEDYMVGEDEEFDESEDEYCSSLADEELEENLGEFEEEDEEEDEEEQLVKKGVKKVGRSRGQQSSQGTKKNGFVKQRKKWDTYSEEGESYEEDCFAEAMRERKSMPTRKEMEDKYDGVFAVEDSPFGHGKPRRKARVSSTEQYADTCFEEPRKKAKVSYQEEMHDSDYKVSDNDDDDDEEFTPDEVDVVDDDEEVPVAKKNKMDRLRMQEARIASGRERKRNVMALKRTKRKKPKKPRVLGRKGRSRIKDFADDNPNWQKKKKPTVKSSGRRQSCSNSDSDFVGSGPPEYEFTMSEEEREQIREASEFCKGLAANLMSSSPVKTIEEEETAPAQRKRQGKKGKDKVVDLKIEVGKQVCGICLSEEGKRTIRGILNCCSHYFCFACIMEWSKVESRCPLCKQRFSTISRTTRADGGHGLRDAVVQVAERDQVYQPTEEELRAYLDPYENVLCAECHQGGDDALMLLCDLCDSPAHTYCVGLGHDVPEGNWYCDGCKPTALASNAQAPIPTPNCGANDNLPVGSSAVGTSRGTFDLNELYVPETPLTQAPRHSPSTRISTGDFPDTPPASGSGVFTLHERRRIQRQIHQLLNNRARQLGGRGDSVAPDLGVGLFGSHGVVLPQDTAPPQNTYHPGRMLSYPATPSWYHHRELPSPLLNNFRERVLPHQDSTSSGQSFSGLSHTNIYGTNSGTAQVLDNQQLGPCNGRPNPGTDGSSSYPYQFREVSRSSLEKAQVQSMVRSQLKSLSRNTNLGYVAFKHIARTSTHTILAACGLQHRWNEVHPVRTRPLMCDHFDRGANSKTCTVAGQCPSCFDWFVKNVVREIMSTQVPLSIA